MQQFVMTYMMIGLMYSAIIFSDPDSQMKTEIMLSGMQIPPENREAFRIAAAVLMMFLWPFDMVARSKL